MSSAKEKWEGLSLVEKVIAVCAIAGILVTAIYGPDSDEAKKLKQVEDAAVEAAEIIDPVTTPSDR